jgi:deoxyribodipyrimidine photo-lyase
MPRRCWANAIPGQCGLPRWLSAPLANISRMTQKYPLGLVWLRRDLRCEDNTALSQALQRCSQVLCVFVFDREILDSLPRADRRVEFIRESLVEVDSQLQALAQHHGHAKAGLLVRHAVARQALPQLATELAVQAVFVNHDYEPQAIARDSQVEATLASLGVAWHSFKDQVIFERQEVLTLAGKPFSVFTPFKNAWLKKLTAQDLAPHPVAAHAAALAPMPEVFKGIGVPSLAEMGFEPTNLQSLKIPLGSSGGAQLFEEFKQRMADYGETRNFPAVKGPSYLGVHLRFGTVSIRTLAACALEQSRLGSEGAAVWLSELIWRDFYAQILSNFPQVAEQAFKPEYDRIAWEKGRGAEELFQAWCSGQTGYPLVDAAMAQINQTGYMHNRLRMVVASFLVKDLGLDWRWGERYFAQHLNDFDLASNNGGWQWAASSGCDAQPYFRIFNPSSQSEKFDTDARFIRKYVPVLAQLPAKAIHAPWLAAPLELAAAGVELGKNYPYPIVRHDEARAITLARYAVVKKASA